MPVLFCSVIDTYTQRSLFCAPVYVLNYYVLQYVSVLAYVSDTCLKVGVFHVFSPYVIKTADPSGRAV